MAAVLLVIIIILFSHTTDVPKPIKSINIASVQSDQNTNTKEKKKKHSNNLKTEIDTTQNRQTSSDKKHNDSKDDNLDYITAYRDWKYFENCYTDIEDFGNNKNPLDTLKERFESNPREYQSQPTTQQNIYYQHHVELCKTLIGEVGDEENYNYKQVMYDLKQRFLAITPNTLEEKQLAYALELIKLIKNIRHQFTQAHYQYSSLTIEQQSQINLQIQQLTEKIMVIYDGNNDLTPEQINLIEEYSDNIDELQNTLTQNNTINYEKITQLEQQINIHLNNMDAFLHTNQSPDAFLILANELYKFNYLQKDSDVLKRFKAQTGIKDNYYIAILNRIVHPLIACSMDYPCDAESDFMLSYCLGLRDSMFNQACGLNLEDFYFNFYIGANQLKDVDTYFNYLVRTYAH